MSTFGAKSKAREQQSEVLMPTDSGLMLPVAEKVAVAKQKEHGGLESKSLRRTSREGEYSSTGASFSLDLQHSNRCKPDLLLSWSGEETRG